MRRIFTAGTPRAVIANAVAASVTEDQAWQVTVEPFRRPRTNQQNAFLWGVVYPTIIEAGGEALRGWTEDDLHEYFLGEVFGWEVLEGMGRKRMKPVRRSSRMTKTEFADYLEAISQRCANLGIVIPEPTHETA
jgi:hypothetical protein